VTAKQHGLKKYIVRLSDEERNQLSLSTLIDKGKHPARKLLDGLVTRAHVDACLPWNSHTLGRVYHDPAYTFAPDANYSPTEPSESLRMRELGL
jgi:hypothetical protein